MFADRVSDELPHFSKYNRSLMSNPLNYKTSDSKAVKLFAFPYSLKATKNLSNNELFNIRQETPISFTFIIPDENAVSRPAAYFVLLALLECVDI